MSPDAQDELKVVIERKERGPSARLGQRFSRIPETRMIAAYRAALLRLKTLDSLNRQLQRRYPESLKFSQLSENERTSIRQTCRQILNELRAEMRRRQLRTAELERAFAICLTTWKADAKELIDLQKLMVEGK